MKAHLISIAAAVVLSAVSVGAFAQSAQDRLQAAHQASVQTAPIKHHRFYNFVKSHVTQSPDQSAYRAH
ncbi:MAG TPA: hypothetical protein VL424_02205 [Pararobbsia sp.]|nr:hypothetical protein [Pararobbsia sp.]